MRIRTRNKLEYGLTR